MVYCMASLSDNLVITRTLEKLERQCGSQLLKLLNDPKTIEIMLNPDGWVWLEQLGSPMRKVFQLSPNSANAIMQTVAGFHGKIVNEQNPILECEFPLDSSRFAGQVFPCVPNPSFTIRKKAVSIFTLEQYVEAGTMTERQKNIIIDAVNSHKNILVVGGTGSGKTTLVNAIISKMTDNFPLERVVIIEDTGEIQCSAENYVQFHTSPNVTMTDLLKTTLRMRPDRILVGEVRGKEALDLLMAWNTGHSGGCATVHANNCDQALERIAMLISMNADYPKPIEPLIASSVHVIVHIARHEHGRRINQILTAEGFSAGKYVTREIS